MNWKSFPIVCRSFRKPGMKRTELYDSLIQSAAELTSREAPRWEFIAARIRYSQFEEELEERLAGLGISGFYGKAGLSHRKGIVRRLHFRALH